MPTASILDENDNYLAPITALGGLLQDQISEHLKNNPQEITSEFTDLERETIEYTKSLMTAIHEADVRTSGYSRFETILKTGGFPFDFKTGGTGGFGTFVENFFELGKIFPEQTRVASKADIPPDEFMKSKGVEVKTRYAHLGDNFHITVGEITLEGGSVTGGPLSDSDIQSLTTEWESQEFLLKVAKERLINKMSNFLFIRVLRKKHQTEFHGAKQVHYSRQQEYNLLTKPRRGYGETEAEIVAFILFMRLIIKKIEELFLEKKGFEDFRINVQESKPTVTKDGVTFKKTFTVELIRQGKSAGPGGYDPLSHLVRELSFIRQLYYQEYDFINKLEREHWKSARMFYWEIKNNVLRRFKFSRIE